MMPRLSGRLDDQLRTDGGRAGANWLSKAADESARQKNDVKFWQQKTPGRTLRNDQGKGLRCLAQKHQNQFDSTNLPGRMQEKTERILAGRSRAGYAALRSFLWAWAASFL